MSNDIDEFAKYFFVVVAIAAAVALSILLIVALPFVALAALPLGAVYVAYIWFRGDPNRAESQQRKLLQEAYERTKGASLSDFSEDDILALLYAHLPDNLAVDVKVHLLRVAQDILGTIDLDTKVPPPPTVANSIEGGRYLDRIAKISTYSPEYVKEAIEHVGIILAYVADLVPDGNGTHKVPARHLIKDQAKVVIDIIDHIFTSDAMKPLRDKLDENLVANKSVMPEDYQGDDVLNAYLKNTPLAQLFDFKVPFSIPDKLRNEHHQIIGGIGHGKTSTLISLILDDTQEDAGMVVIDSQGDLIENLATRLPQDRVILVSPKCAPAMNPFALSDRSEGGVTRALALLSYVFGSGGMVMTKKQSMVYSYISNLCMTIPGATIDTFRELLDLDNYEQFAPHIAKLDKHDRDFFKSYYAKKSNQFTETREEINTRISGLLRTKMFIRMFGASEVKLDIPQALREGKIILVNTKSIDTDDLSAVIGRLFIAHTLQAARNREEYSRQRIYLYCDEFADFADDSKMLTDCFSQGRKYNLAMVICFQLLKPLNMDIRAFIAACTNIKFAGGVSPDDIEYMAKQMSTTTEVITAQPALTFWAYFKGHGQMPWTVDPTRLKSMPELRSYSEIEADMRVRYGEELAETPHAEEEEFKEIVLPS